MRAILRRLLPPYWGLLSVAIIGAAVVGCAGHGTAPPGRSVSDSGSPGRNHVVRADLPPPPTPPPSTPPPTTPPVGSCGPGNYSLHIAHVCHVAVGGTASFQYTDDVPAATTFGFTGDSCSKGTWGTNHARVGPVSEDDPNITLTVNPTTTGSTTDCGTERFDTVTLTASSSPSDTGVALYLNLVKPIRSASRAVQ